MRITSNASRHLYKITSLWHHKARVKKLEFRRLSKAGKGILGQTVVYTKSRFLMKIRKPVINYSYRFRLLTFVSTLKLVPFENKLVALIMFAQGFTYVQVNDTRSIFEILYFPVRSGIIGRFFKSPSFFLFHNIKKLCKVSLMELFPGNGIQYARSSGTSGKIIRFDYSTHNVMVKLPSGVRKCFSLYSLVTPGHVALKIKRNWKNTKSGYWRTFGKKPHTRGVARNPVDHPHGGRTKSIKYPRTPWGKTTKYK